MSKQLKKILKNEEIIGAIEDRKKGFSYSEITNKYGMSFRKAKELLSKIDISPEFKAIWISKRGGSKKSAQLRYQYIKDDVQNFYSSGPAFTAREKLLVLSSLYWGEGTKKELSFANSDPKMVKIFVALLLGGFNLPKDRISVSIRIFEDMSAEKCRMYWEDFLSLPVYQVYVLKGKKVGKLAYGMCRIRLKGGTNILNSIKAHIESISDILAPIAQQDRAKVS